MQDSRTWITGLEAARARPTGEELAEMKRVDIQRQNEERAMNHVQLSGTVATVEHRIIATDRELVNINIIADAGIKDDAPKIRCAFFPRGERPRSIKPGQRVVIIGSLKHRRDQGLFVAVQEIFVIRDVDAESRSATSAQLDVPSDAALLSQR
jgi:hypothetical protein